jgi:adenylate cyclase
VNLASRVTGIARPSTVVVTEATRDAARDGDGDERWRFSPLPNRHLKGVDGIVPLYRVRAAELSPA